MLALRIAFGGGVDLKTQLSLKLSCTITNTGLANIAKTFRLCFVFPCSTEISKIRKAKKQISQKSWISWTNVLLIPDQLWNLRSFNNSQFAPLIVSLKNLNNGPVLVELLPNFKRNSEISLFIITNRGLTESGNRKSFLENLD